MGRWAEIPNTKIRSVLPSPVPQGDPAALVLAWNSAALDTRRNRLLVWGGGHGDYYGNEMYALDLPTLSIQRITNPSPYTSQSNCTSALPDGTPTARHTYDGLTYIAHTDQFFSVHGALAPCGGNDNSTWVYDFPSSTWMHKVTESQSPLYSGPGTQATYDPVSRLVYVKDLADLWSYSPEANRYTRLPGSSAIDYHLSGTIDTKRRKYVMLGDGVQVVDLTTGQMTRMATTGAPAFVTSQQYPGVEYDPVSDRVVAWHGGSNVYALNLDTGVWTQVNTGNGPTTAAPYQGTNGRWAYVPAYRVFVVINSIDENAWVFRLTP